MKKLVTRRSLLGGAGASAAAFSTLRPRMGNAATRAVDASVYPISQPTISGPYPEQTIARFSAASGQWGVAFSGGGPRAFSAAIGQMRGLEAAGVLDNVGAISCVSGGAWFGTTFTYAPTTYSDAALLGPLVQPENITVSGLHQIPKNYLGSCITNLSDGALAVYALEAYIEYKANTIPADKFYSRIINKAFLQPYGLGDEKTLVTLNADTLASIKQRNLNLSASFFVQRPNRPFLIVGGTQIYTPGQVKQQVKQVGLPGQFYRNIEFTSLYTGAAQLANESSLGTSFGGGFVENFAFDTPAPTLVSGNMASVPAGKYPFLLSDMIGCSSAAIAAYVLQDLQAYKNLDPFPSFTYWPISGSKPQATAYSFGDGGILENTGVVSLLRRGYKTIFAFVNSPLPIGSVSKESVMGIDSQISRLFGFVPEQNDGTPQTTQVFASADYQAVVDGLIAAKKAGIATVYTGNFPVIENNAFNIAPYTPKIFWIYNDRNMVWMNKLRPAVVALFKNAGLQNFPNYSTTFQNEYELLYLAPRQVNLLAHMWAYTVSEGLKESGYAFGVPIH